MSETMRAIGYRRSRPITDPESLLDLTLPIPAPGPHDLLVRVEAVAVNPVDVKVRASSDPGGVPKVLGWDAAGTVSRVGDAVTLFRPGDDVFYAGTISRPGSNSQFQVVDERLVGPKPSSLDFGAAAALPLTAITAWEVLFDRLRLTPAGDGDQGAHQVINHHEGFGTLTDSVDYVFSPVSAGMIETYASILRPYGSIVAIDEPAGLDLVPLKEKSITWHWEFMFTRGRYDPSSAAQHDILVRIAELVDKGVLHTTETKRFDGITAANLRAAHEVQESGSAIGKTVLVGF